MGKQKIIISAWRACHQTIGLAQRFGLAHSFDCCLVTMNGQVEDVGLDAVCFFWSGPSVPILWGGWDFRELLFILANFFEKQLSWGKVSLDTIWKKNNYQKEEQKSYETCTKSQLLYCRIYSYEKSEAYHGRIEWSYCYGSDVTNTLIDHLSSRHGPLYNWLSFSVLMVDGPMGKMIILSCLESWGSHVPIMKVTLLIWCDMMWDKKRCDMIRWDKIRYDMICDMRQDTI